MEEEIKINNDESLDKDPDAIIEEALIEIGCFCEHCNID